MNLIEVWFGIIERQAIRRGSFTSIKELKAAIETFIQGWNDRCHPFVWNETGEAGNAAVEALGVMTPGD